MGGVFRSQFKQSLYMQIVFYIAIIHQQVSMAGDVVGDDLYGWRYGWRQCVWIPMISDMPGASMKLSILTTNTLYRVPLPVACIVGLKQVLTWYEILYHEQHPVDSGPMTCRLKTQAQHCGVKIQG